MTSEWGYDRPVDGWRVTVRTGEFVIDRWIPFSLATTVRRVQRQAYADVLDEMIEALQDARRAVVRPASPQ